MPPPVQQPGRPLTLTEELEKLDQSITLTLQEIDHNFSRTHQIITTSILPLIEKYATHSSAVWEGSKFWKTFFEASANVSLSGYEELAAADLTALSTSRLEESSEIEIPKPIKGGDIAAFDSPYEALRREMKGEESSSVLGGPPTEHNSVLLPRPSTRSSTSASVTDDEEFEDEGEDTIHGLPEPIRRQHSPPSTPQSSPFRSALASANVTASFIQDSEKPKDRLLHHVLDKTYRLQATPRKTYTPSVLPSARKTPGTARLAGRDLGEDPWSSSPVGPAPELDGGIFSSPAKTPVRKPRTPKPASSAKVPRPAAKTPQQDYNTIASQQQMDDEITWSADLDSSDEEGGQWDGMSPPKTIQFYVPTEQRLMRTPAREASKMIVADLLNTAGARYGDDESDLDLGLAPMSTSDTRARGMNLEDEEDSFDLKI